MSKVSFKEMKKGTKEDYLLLDSHEKEFIQNTPYRIMNFLSTMKETLEGYQISRLEHSLQTATRALNDGASDEMIVAALLHDIGDDLASVKSCRICCCSFKTLCKRKNTLDN